MEQYPIRSFRPVETREDNTDQDRTVLRLCEGMLAVPVGALCSGPRWKPLWGITDLAAQCTAALAGANIAKAHFVTVTRGNHVWLVVWSLATSAPLGWFYVTTSTPADFDFDSTSSVTVASTNNSVYRNKDGSAYWFASRIADRWYFGNGVDDNVQWKDGALIALGPASTPTDVYDPSRVKIPACTSFVMSETRSILAAGNAAAPKRVWVTAPPTKDYPFIEGIYDLTTSYIDLSYTEATRITALTAFQNYVTAHTDAKPVNLFDIDGTNDGWKCRQAPGAANSSAPSPAAVRDTNGMASFYVGADGEIYQDQAIRVGPNDKRAAREQDIATDRALGWNRDMETPVTSGRVHTAYDRRLSLFWVFAEMGTWEGHMGLWVYNERNRSVTGPFRYPNALASAAVANTPTSTIVGIVTHGGEMLYADLSAIGETEAFLLEDADTELGADYAQLSSAPTPTPGYPFVAMTADSSIVAEVDLNGDFALRDLLDSAGNTITNSNGAPLRSQPLSGLRTSMATVWSQFAGGGSYTFTKFWKDAYVARFETTYMDFGDARLRKNYLELTMTWQRHSRAYVGIYAETDGGLRRGRFKGLVFDKETHVIPLNVEGRRIRVRVVAVLFNNAPALLRDMAIGWLPAGQT
jgi:hypothetical protein